MLCESAIDKRLQLCYNLFSTHCAEVAGGNFKDLIALMLLSKLLNFHHAERGVKNNRYQNKK